MAYSIGKFRHKVEIQSPVNSTDSGGGSARTWSTVSSVWGQVTPTTGTESVKQGQLQETLSLQVVIRHTDNIGTNYRIKYNNRFLNIKHLRNVDERNRYIIMQCEEGVAT
mgnify:CR=1 FL=1